MLFHQIILPFFLFSVPLVSAASIGQVSSANEALTDQTNNANTDVNSLDLVSMQVPKDLQGLATNLNASRVDSAGVAASSDEGTEETVSDSFNDLAGATTTLMNNLVSKKTIFITALEGNAIYSALQSYFGAFLAYQDFQASLVTSTAVQDAIFESGGASLSAIDNAVNQFEPDSTTVKRGIAFDV